MNDALVDNLVLGGVSPLTDVKTLASGQSVVRGQVLGKLTSGGNLAAYVSTNNDGTGTAFSVAAETVDATGGAKPILFFRLAELSEDALVFSASGDSATEVVKDALAARSVFIKKTV